jgi:hypothetical protein
MTLRSFFKFLFKERLGKYRPSPVTPHDHQMREAFLDRDAQLRIALSVDTPMWLKRPPKNDQ